MKPADKPVLCVVSSHPIKGASGVPTGLWADSPSWHLRMKR